MSRCFLSKSDPLTTFTKQTIPPRPHGNNPTRANMIASSSKNISHPSMQGNLPSRPLTCKGKSLIFESPKSTQPAAQHHNQQGNRVGFKDDSKHLHQRYSTKDRLWCPRMEPTFQLLQSSRRPQPIGNRENTKRPADPRECIPIRFRDHRKICIKKPFWQPRKR